MALRLFIFLLLFIAPAMALEADEMLADPAQEARAVELSEEIRCVVCQAESIADSPALIAQDLRRFIRAQIVLGKSDEAIKAELRTRYGDKILMSPPLRRDTGLLWAAPVLLLLAGLWMARGHVKRWRR